MDPLRDKLFRIVGGSQRGLQFGKRVVVEAKISSNKFLFQNGGPGEEHHGGALGLVVRNQQHFAFALEECAGNVAGYVLGESDRAIVKRNVEGRALQRNFANVVDPRLVQSDVAQSQIQSFGRMLRRD